jgi:hypothetical protein
MASSTFSLLNIYLILKILWQKLENLQNLEKKLFLLLTKNNFFEKKFKTLIFFVTFQHLQK